MEFFPCNNNYYFTDETTYFVVVRMVVHTTGKFGGIPNHRTAILPSFFDTLQPCHQHHSLCKRLKCYWKLIPHFVVIRERGRDSEQAWRKSMDTIASLVENTYFSVYLGAVKEIGYWSARISLKLSLPHSLTWVLEKGKRHIKACTHPSS